MNVQEEFRKCLANRFAELRAARGEQYSLRRFAKDLSQNPAALSQILSGKRNVSRKFALTMAERAGFDPASKQRLETGFAAPVDDDASINHERWRLPLDEYELIANWRYFAVLSLAETDDFRGEADWIATRLGLKPRETERILDRLERLGLLVRSDDGRLHHAGKAVCSSDDIASLALKRRHEDNLDAAHASIYRDPVERRDFTFVTMAVDPTRLSEAKRMIRRFTNELCTFLEGGERKEVYEVCVQLFPRTVTDSLKRE